MRNSRSQILQNPGAADIKTDRIEVSYLPIAQLELNPRDHRRDPRSGHPTEHALRDGWAEPENKAR